jgi:hypothetical protein
LGHFLKCRRITNPDCPDVNYFIDFLIKEEQKKPEAEKRRSFNRKSKKGEGRNQPHKETNHTNEEQEEDKEERVLKEEMEEGERWKPVRGVLVDYTISGDYKKGTDITSYLVSKIFPISEVDVVIPNSEKEDEESLSPSPSWSIIGTPPSCGIDPLSYSSAGSTSIDPRTDIDFLQKVGGNTFYVSHPEEIIAGTITH